MTDGATRFLLEPAAYTDPEWFAREQRLVFGRTWHVVAHAEQLPQPGDFVTVRVGGTPIAIVRGADGELPPRSTTSAATGAW